MNLLTAPWIPVRSGDDTGELQFITYKELLCDEGREGNWRISMPRDDLELTCLQLLVSLTQVIFLPTDETKLTQHLKEKLMPEEFAKRIVPFQDWFDLAHPTQPFMQTRGVKAQETTSIQKLLIGLPEGNNHAFFNKVGEAHHISPGCAAIALFNQASNCPSFGGGFKGSLRGGAPITTLVYGETLRETVWRNIVTLQLIRREGLPNYEPDFTRDKPTWIEPIVRNETIYASNIGLLRGLFWQPAHIELIPTEVQGRCDLTGQTVSLTYASFRAEKFSYLMQGLWPHPHGVRVATKKKGKVEWKYSSFTTTAPAWTQLCEFVLPGMDADANEGTIPAAVVLQNREVNFGQGLHFSVGGYRNKQAAVLERRHELISLAQGWDRDVGSLLQRLIQLGKDAKKILRSRLFYASQGDKKKGFKGIGAPVHETGEKMYYAMTEAILHEFLQDSMTFKEFKTARKRLAESLKKTCTDIFEKLTNPFAFKPELVPIIAVTRRLMDFELHSLVEGGQTDAKGRKKQKRTET